MDACQGPCLYHCTAKSNGNVKYLLVGLCLGLFLGVLLFKHCNNEQNKVPQHEEK
jgi:hypothetical protein